MIDNPFITYGYESAVCFCYTSSLHQIICPSRFLRHVGIDHVLLAFGVDHPQAAVGDLGRILGVIVEGLSQKNVRR